MSTYFMCIVLQSPLTSLNPALRIRTLFKEAWYAHAKGTSEECLAAVRSALQSVSLPDDDDFLKRRPSQLSVGQGQRVIIAMAMLHRPALLIADVVFAAEPSEQVQNLGLCDGVERAGGFMAILYNPTTSCPWRPYATG